MAYLRYLFLISLGIQLACSKPHHVKRVQHVKKLVRPCVQLAASAGEIIDISERIFSLPPGTTQRTVSAFTDIDIYDQSDRERVLCTLEGLSTLSEFLEAIADVGLDYDSLKAAHAVFSAFVREGKYVTQQNIDNPNEWTDERYERITLELLTNLEAFGFIGLNPVGEQAIIDLLDAIPHNGLHTHTELEPPSTLPLDAQCAQFTNSIRKLWNREMRQAMKWNPNASVEARALIQHWTGIQITDHDSVKAMVCDVMDRMQDDGLEGIYDWIVDNRIMNYALKAGYPYIQEGFQHAKQGLGNEVNRGQPNERDSIPPTFESYGGLGYDGPGYGDTGYSGPVYGGSSYGGPGYGGPGYGGPGYGGPDYGGSGPSPQDMVVLFQNLMIMLENVELMGLISLADDL